MVHGAREPRRVYLIFKTGEGLSPSLLTSKRAPRERDEYAKIFLEPYLATQTAVVDVSCIQIPFLHSSEEDGGVTTRTTTSSTITFIRRRLKTQSTFLAEFPRGPAPLCKSHSIRTNTGKLLKPFTARLVL